MQRHIASLSLPKNSAVCSSGSGKEGSLGLGWWVRDFHQRLILASCQGLVMAMNAEISFLESGGKVPDVKGRALFGNLDSQSIGQEKQMPDPLALHSGLHL